MLNLMLRTLLDQRLVKSYVSCHVDWLQTWNLGAGRRFLAYVKYYWKQTSLYTLNASACQSRLTFRRIVVYRGKNCSHTCF